MNKQTDNIVTIPVSGRMVKQADGSWRMESADYITTTADAVARFLLNAFHISTGEQDWGGINP